MRRSSSAPRVSDEAPSPPPPPPTLPTTTSQSRCSRTGEPDDDRREQQLPTCDPLSHAARKERSRLRSAENAVHGIPVLLVLCAFVLWFFSSPGSEF